MLPADQRLDSDDPALGDGHHGLVDEPELVVVERGAKLGLHGHPFEQASPHSLVEDLDTTVAGGLGAVHRGVRVSEDRRRGGVAVIDDHHPGADRDPVLIAADRHRLTACLRDPAGDGHGVGLGGQVLAEDHELVAAEPGDRVAGAQRRA